MAAVLHGAPVATLDLDLVHSREPGNLDRLLAALAALDARYRDPGQRELKPGRSHLASAGHQLLITRHGPLDLLGAIGRGHDYADLLPETVELRIGSGIAVRVLDLPALIRVKQETASEKDRAVLPILRRTLEEKLRGPR